MFWPFELYMDSDEELANSRLQCVLYMFSRSKLTYVLCTASWMQSQDMRYLVTYRVVSRYLVVDLNISCRSISTYPVQDILKLHKRVVYMSVRTSTNCNLRSPSESAAQIIRASTGNQVTISILTPPSLKNIVKYLIMKLKIKLYIYIYIYIYIYAWDRFNLRKIHGWDITACDFLSITRFLETFSALVTFKCWMNPRLILRAM